jgi:hypothetical protein
VFAVHDQLIDITFSFFFRWQETGCDQQLSGEIAIVYWHQNQFPASTIPEFLGRSKSQVSKVVNRMKKSSADTDFLYSLQNRSLVRVCVV